MKSLRNGLLGAVLVMAFVAGNPGTASAHNSPPAYAAYHQGAVGWLDHGSSAGDGAYWYVLVDTDSDGRCGVLQYASTAGSWNTLRARACPEGAVREGMFRAPAGGVFFRVCTSQEGTDRIGLCGQAVAFSDT